LVAVQFDVEAALRRHLAIPQTRDRRYNIKLYHYLSFSSARDGPKTRASMSFIN
jgi:hypothetical protein